MALETGEPRRSVAAGPVSGNARKPSRACRGAPSAALRRVWTILYTEGHLAHVPDPADRKVQPVLGSSAAELTGP